MDDQDKNSTLSSVRKVIEGAAKGVKGYILTQGYKYTIIFNDSKSCVIKVVDNTVKGYNWIIRVDKPHPHLNIDYNHVNINPKFSGVRDPHVALPSGSLQVATGVANLCTVANKIASIVAYALDGWTIGSALKKDYETGSTKYTVEAVVTVGGPWCGAITGGKLGSAIGTAVFPGIGTIGGGIIGSLSGGIGGIYVASGISSTVANKVDDGLKNLYTRIGYTNWQETAMSIVKKCIPLTTLPIFVTITVRDIYGRSAHLLNIEAIRISNVL